MTGPEFPPKPRGPVPAAITVSVASVLVLLSVLVVAPAATMIMLPLVVGASELSPLLVLADLAWCLAAVRLLRGRRALRAATIAMLVAAAVVAIRPLTRFTRTAASASGQLGTASSPPRFSLLTAVRGLPSRGDVVERVVPYAAADGSPLTMRLFSVPSSTLAPVVVVIYGGAWRGGNARQSANVSRALASRGYAVAAIDYRHAPRFRYPAQLEDVQHALALLRDSASSWRMDIKRMAVLGRSSGGHLAELAAFAPGDIPVKAVIAIYSPFDLAEGFRDRPSPDLIDVRRVLRDFLGGTPTERPEAYKASSPSTYVRPGLPPTLLLFGAKDHIVKPDFNRRATTELRAAHVPVVSVELPWAEHGFDMVSSGLGAQLAFFAISEFLDRELKH